jgi:hypothetical protein
VYGADSEKREFQYDPSTCKTDAQGKLYIALGRNVLAVPTSGSVVVARYGDNWLKPPDPAEPMGCPGNPQQLSGYAFPYAFNAVVGNKDSAFPSAHARADVLQLIRIRGNAEVPSPDDTEWRGESFQSKIAKAVCEKAVPEELSNGFTACRLSPTDKTLRVEEWRTTYVGRSDIYTTPLNRPFVVNCDDHVYTSPVGDCGVTYVFRPDLGVTYNFRPYRSSTPLPIDKIIEFDRGLRTAITGALVENYRWPDQAPSNDKSNAADNKP